MRARQIARLAAVIMCVGMAPVISYGFALAGEPQSVWLWRDVFGIVPEL